MKSNKENTFELLKRISFEEMTNVWSDSNLRWRDIRTDELFNSKGWDKDDWWAEYCRRRDSNE